ncbi:alpha/beta hydrolase fold domain-containing protein [Rhizobium sp. No.120]
MGDGRFGLSRERMITLFNQYVPANVERSQPSISPALGDVGTLPPTWLCVAECDPLRDDTIMFAERLSQIRTTDRCLVVPGVTPHVREQSPTATCGKTGHRGEHRMHRTHRRPDASPAAL